MLADFTMGLIHMLEQSQRKTAHSTLHLFYIYKVLWCIWNARNKHTLDSADHRLFNMRLVLSEMADMLLAASLSSNPGRKLTCLEPAKMADDLERIHWWRDNNFSLCSC